MSLLEIMIALVVIGIVAAIAISQYAKYHRMAQDSDAKKALYQLVWAQEEYFSQYQTYTRDQKALYKSTGWFVEKPLAVTILAATMNSWSATASHEATGNTWTFSYPTEGLR